MAINLTDVQKSSLFKSLATKTFYDVGIEYGFDKHYKTPASIKTAVYTLYRRVLAEPEKYSVHPEVLSLVSKAIQERGILKSAPNLKPTMAEQGDLSDIKALLLSNRDVASRLIHKKLRVLDTSKKALKGESIVSLGKIFGILFDKAQIIQGQATEHILQLSHINVDMSPSEAIDAVIKMREQQISESSKDK